MEQEGAEAPDQQEPTGRPGLSSRAVIVLVVVAVFAGVIAAKYLPSVRTGGSPSPASKASVTSVRNDAAADYETAAKTGKPIYVLFHSLS